MAKAMVVFEDNGNNVDISMQNVLSDDQTFAQEAALLLFKKLKLEIETIRLEKKLEIKIE